MRRASRPTKTGCLSFLTSREEYAPFPRTESFEGQITWRAHPDQKGEITVPSIGNVYLRTFRFQLATALLLIAFASMTFALPSEAAEVDGVPSPEEILGFVPGTDRHLADMQQLNAYFTAVAATSDRVRVEQVGTSTLGRPMLLATISSPENLQSLNRIKQAQKKLADPRGLQQSDIDTLVADGKVVVFINNAIHSTEVGAPLFASKLLHYLATDDSEQTKSILRDTVLLMNISNNPDGIDLVANWYRDTLDTEYEGTAPPQLYHFYTGHDNNRDWFHFSQEESKVWGRILYQEWFPQIVWDVHQMGNRGARFFFPPFFDPPNPEIDATILGELSLLSGVVTTNLSKAGLTGVATNAIYDQWWHGGFRTAPYYHNMVGILTEAASAQLATPIEQDISELTGSSRGLPDPRQRYTNFPEPWQGGRWGVGEIIEYEFVTALSILDTASTYRTQWLENFVSRNQNSVEAGETSAPYAFVFPPEQRDSATLAYMMNVLLFQGMEVHQTTTVTQINDKTYPAGSYVILTSQPTRPNVMALLAKQEYPPRFEYPGGPAERPYDVAAWTLPLQMGIDYDEILEPIPHSVADKLDRIDAASYPTGEFSGSSQANFGYIFGPEMNNAASARFALLKTGFDVYWTTDTVEIDGENYAPGSTIVPQGPGVTEEVMRLMRELSLSVRGLEKSPEVTVDRLRLPRVGFFDSQINNYDEGWTRWIFDTYEIDYTRVDDAEVRRGELRSQYDILIVANWSADQIVNGRAPGSMPPEWTGGIGEEGVQSLRSFVDEGGTLLLFEQATGIAGGHLDIPVANALSGVPSSEFYAPGSIMKAHYDPSHPVAYGMPATGIAYFHRSWAFDVTEDNVEIVARYDEEDPLLSGWILGPEHLKNKAAVVDAPFGEGHVVMIAFRAQHRAQPFATFKLVFNPVFRSAASPSELP